MHKYSTFETGIANIPYLAMILLGALTIAYSYAFSAWGIIGAAGYLVYGIGGAFWIIIFVCPSCRYYASTECPCGYGMISSKIVKKGNRDCFTEKFRRHIPVIVPLWIIPAVCGGIGLFRSFSWWLLGLVLLFIVESWVILPLISRKYSCVTCPQKDQCPWMTKVVKDT
ncbi:MAG: hypothetical protein ACMUJM_19990 [bacterium]